VATTNLHTGFALGFSAILLPQLEKYTDEMGELSKSQSSWIGKNSCFRLKSIILNIRFYIN